MTAAGAAWPAHVGGRTHQPVRRGSQPFEAGEAFYRPLKKARVVHIMRAAERLAVGSMRHRPKAKVRIRRYGELHLPDLHILEALLFRFTTWKTGKCDPTYAQIAELTGHARDTIAGALARLTKAGILQRLRRFIRIEDAEGKGPRVEQAANAYRFELPAALRALRGMGGEGPPIPDDAACAKRDSYLTNSEQEAAWTGKPNLGSVLVRWGEAVAQRESGK